MDAQQPNTDAAPRPWRFSRRTLFRLAIGGAAAGLTFETARVLGGSNEHTVIPGKVYRSAQLSQEKLQRVIGEKKIRTVINLRGCCPETGWYMNDARATNAMGISQEDLTFSAKRYPHPGELKRLIEVFDRTEYPVIMHCAAGADRTGLASTIARLLMTDDDLATARRQMWPRYGHFRVGRTALLDEFFDYYEEWLAERNEPHTPDRFRTFATTVYCPGPYRAELTVLSPMPLVFPSGRGFVVEIRAANRSVEPWTFRPGGSGGIQLRYMLYTHQGTIAYRGHAGFCSRTVPPGESIDFAIGFPSMKAGKHTLHVDLLDGQPIDLLDTNFAQYGSEPLFAELTVK